MSMKPYPEYKDSGFEWLGSIPKMWRLNKFRHVFAESSEVNGPSPVGEMLSISGYRGVELKNYDDENQKRSNDQLETYRVVRAGQLAVNTMWLNYAGLGVSSIEGHVSPAYRAYWIHPSMNRRYVHYLMRSAVFVDGYTANLTGIRPNSLQMSRPALMSFPVIVPPIAEQQTIADYLDRETAEIDAFIADQEELITLLAERRTATITQAVTKGLNPDAPMKNSGVEWLGEIPCEWQVGSVKKFGQVTLGKMIQPSQKSSREQQLPYLRAASIQPHGLELGNMKRMWVSPEEETTLTLRKNDVVVVEGGAGYGRSAVLTEDLCGWAFQNSINRIRPEGENSGSYLDYAIKAFVSSGYLEVVTNKATIPHLTAEKLSSLSLSIPTAVDQLQIVEYLDRETADIDAAITDAREAIALSKERRAAVISAAVTGKIDVRGLVDPEASSVEGASVGAA